MICLGAEFCALRCRRLRPPDSGAHPYTTGFSETWLVGAISARIGPCVSLARLCLASSMPGVVSRRARVRPHGRRLSCPCRAPSTSMSTWMCAARSQRRVGGGGDVGGKSSRVSARFAGRGGRGRMCLCRCGGVQGASPRGGAPGCRARGRTTIWSSKAAVVARCKWKESEVTRNQCRCVNMFELVPAR